MTTCSRGGKQARMSAPIRFEPSQGKRVLVWTIHHRGEVERSSSKQGLRGRGGRDGMDAGTPCGPASTIW